MTESAALQARRQRHDHWRGYGHNSRELATTRRARRWHCACTVRPSPRCRRVSPSSTDGDVHFHPRRLVRDFIHRITALVAEVLVVGTGRGSLIDAQATELMDRAVVSRNNGSS